MARLIIGEGIGSEDLFIPDHLFTFGSIVLHANPTGHLDQIKNFAPEHQIRFSNLEYVVDTRGNLIFAKLTAPSRTLTGLVMPALEYPSVSIYRSAPAL